ncbi:MAG TPA: hypothetical protein VJ783_13130 [Pirellulales bacterium]|nr:hypothetical protein [Pirellulales bacterium]
MAQERDQIKKTRGNLALRVEALANKNRRPELVDLVDRVDPLFPDDYDWAEAKRARRAFVEVARDESVEIFEEVLKHLDDERYAFTAAHDGDFAENYTVGWICKDIAYHRLVSAFEDDLSVTDIGLPPRLDPGIEDDLAGWRRKHESKSLFELQIEVCRLALSQIDRCDELSAEAKRESRRGINARIRQLEKTRRPLFRRFPLDGFNWFDADKAARIRQRLKDEKQGD